MLKKELCDSCKVYADACLPQAIHFDKKNIPVICIHYGTCARFYNHDILELINRNDNNGDTGISAKGYDDVIAELSSWLDEDELKDIVANMDKSKDFALVRISYHNDILTDMIHDNKSIKILYEMG